MPGTGGPLRLQMSPSRLLSAAVTACLFPGSLARPGRVPPGTTFRTRLLSQAPLTACSQGRARSPTSVFMGWLA